MTVTVALIAAVFLLLAGGFFSGAEMGLYCLNRIRLRLNAQRDDQPAARALLPLARDSQETVLALLISTNVANYGFTALWIYYHKLSFEKIKTYSNY